MRDERGYMGAHEDGGLVSVTFRQCAPASLSQITAKNGSDEQTFGAK